MRIGDLHVTISGAGAMRSIASVAAVALQYVADDVGRDLAQRLGALLDEGDLFGAEPADLAATGTGKLDLIELHPGDRYVELAAAIAAHGNADIATFHGWPVLSVGSLCPTVTDAGDVRNVPGGGAT